MNELESFKRSIDRGFFTCPGGVALIPAFLNAKMANSGHLRRPARVGRPPVCVRRRSLARFKSQVERDRKREREREQVFGEAALSEQGG